MSLNLAGEGATRQNPGPRAIRRPWSAWTTSALLHALFLLLIGVLQLGVRGGAEHLQLSATPAEVGLPLALVEPKCEDSDPQLVTSDWSTTVEREEAALLQIESPLNVIALAGEFEKGASIRSRFAANEVSEGASFFGAVANGDRFVYILDVSPSMNRREGKRLERAVLELLRSIDQLTEQQSFYVMVFGWQTRRMFDDRSTRPRMVPATLDKKRALREWLANLRTIPGTDPRAAIALGLRIQPSAIFLLSDGEFNQPKRRGSSVLGRPVIDVIRRARPDVVPIHAVTFEDPVGGRAMDRLAEESKGSNRFIPAPPRESSRGRLRYEMWPSFRHVVSGFTFHDEVAAGRL